jgi:hypothetical protein
VSLSFRSILAGICLAALSAGAMPAPVSGLPVEVFGRVQGMAAAIRGARRASQGDLFTLPLATEQRRRITVALGDARLMPEDLATDEIPIVEIFPDALEAAELPATQWQMRISLPQSTNSDASIGNASSGRSKRSWSPITSLM